jgi:hypothetical protein
MHVSTAVSRHSSAASVSAAAAATDGATAPISSVIPLPDDSSKDAAPRTRSPLRRWMLPLLIILVVAVIGLSVLVHVRSLSVGKKLIKKGNRRRLRDVVDGPIDAEFNRPPPVFNDLGALEPTAGGSGGLLLDAAAASDVAKAGASIDASLMISGPMAGGFGGETGVGQEVDIAAPVQEVAAPEPSPAASSSAGGDAGAVSVPVSPTHGELPFLVNVPWTTAGALQREAVRPVWAAAGRVLLDALASGSIALGGSALQRGRAGSGGGSGPSLSARLLAAAAAASALQRGGSAAVSAATSARFSPSTNLLYPDGRVRAPPVPHPPHPLQPSFSVALHG